KRHKNKKSSKIQEQIFSYFNLSSYPNSIEVFDNSHLGGRANVGGIISWENESFNKNKYRHYHLENKDEYAQMKELLTQRAQRFHKDYPPDLWLIDGGATLLNLAHKIIQSSGIEIDILAISKEKVDAKSNRSKGKAKDIIHSLKGSYNLNEHDEKLQFLQKLRDEAHRFAISFHRKTKLKQDKESSLLKKRGLSEAKIKKLLYYFGTFEAIREAKHEEIEKLIGKKEALKLTS
ncbi:MAG: excinuclease ABC subunit C, partial [Proteobacteria bacterium]